MASFTPINEVVQSAAMGELKSKKNVEPEEVDHSDEVSLLVLK